MDGSELFLACLAQATAVVKQVRYDHFANVTPDTDWNVRDLLNHMLYELKWVPDMLAGSTIEEVGTVYDGDLVGKSDIDLSANWQAAADTAEQAIIDVDPEEIIHLSFGDRTVEEYLMMAGSDQLIHTWDLGKAIGVPVKFGSHLAQLVYDTTLPNKDDMQGTGLFASVIAVDESADIQTKLLALFGRAADWQPTA